MPLVATKLIPGHALSRYKPYQTKPNHNKKYQTPTKKPFFLFKKCEQEPNTLWTSTFEILFP